MVDIANKHRVGHRLNLRMAAETKIRIALGEQLGIDGAVRAVANRAPFTQRRMLEDERSGLGAVARAAGVVLARHGQSAGRFEDVRSMRIVALCAANFFLQKRMVLWQMKFRLRRTVAFKTG